jgi:2-isopropylmalate synthase
VVYKSVEVLDTTLRDGAQGVGVSFTLNDKLRIAELLDILGVDYIEGGWPSSNPKDKEFFKKAKELSLSHSKLAAFGSTRKKGVKPHEDQNLQAIIESDVEVGVIFGKCWTLHVERVLNVSKEENLEMIRDSVEYLRAHGLKVIFDAEHFYQGHLHDHEYALSALKAAYDAGAHTIVLADTNGAMLPHQVYEITKKVVQSLNARIGLHMHNDSGCAVANTLIGVVAGATHIQGTINGLGERTGNADLVQILPSLLLKLRLTALKGEESLKTLKFVSKAVYQILGETPNPKQPYVGEDAFSHKAGVHADAVLKCPSAYEHIEPSLVGNTRKIVISELSGGSNLIDYVERLLGAKIHKRDERVMNALSKIKQKEKEGYSYDNATVSAILILLKELGLYKNLIKLEHWNVVTNSERSVAVVKANSFLEAAEDVGPVAAIDKALRKALLNEFPFLSMVFLTDYKVNLPGERKSTESVVRVNAEFSDGKSSWRTVGVSANIVDASIQALLDGYDFYVQAKALALERF